jgi:hypothetical protein
MKRRVAFAALVAALAGVSATASPAFPIPLKKLYAEAQTVAAVEVLEGRVVSAGGETCGARYKGRVIESMKNASAGTTIEFGYLPQLKVGASYLVLLGELRDSPMPNFSTFEARCRDALPPATIVALWRGAMEIEGDTTVADKRTSWTVRSVNYVVYPLGTRTTTVRGEKQLWFADLVRRMTDAR